MSGVQVVVEHAGCDSCAARVQRALARLATVHEVTIDEEADVAVVLLSAPSISEEDVNDALREASMGAGHEYRVRPGPWRVEQAQA